MVEGFIPFPVYVHMTSGEKMDGANCKLANREASKNRKLDSTYVPHLGMMEDIKPVIQHIYRLSEGQL